jgi:hypothetical protein
MADRPEWFAPKRFGIGTGWPIAWQGWALLAGWAALIGLALLIFGPEDLSALAIVIPATVAVAIIMARTTRGGWHWRWGEKE